MPERISPATRIAGEICLPGDKSISHRYAMLAAIAEGGSRIHNYSTGADCHSTLGCVRALGIAVDEQGSDVTIQGQGLDGLKPPASDLDAGNSGSTMRMLSGILAAQPFTSRMVGDESLSRRPMGRVIKPLSEMGASILAREGGFPPLEIRGAKLRPIDYTLPVASAQVKSCILFAALYATGATVVREPMRSRDHTEIALRELGAEVRVERRVISLQGRPRLTGRELFVPADISSAAFFLVAALLVPGSELVLRGVGLNPTRSTLLDVLVSMGGSIRVLDVEQRNGELVGQILAKSSDIRGGVIEKETTAALIDEIPVLAILGAASQEGLLVRDAAELRVKETDRIATVSENLKRMGVQCEVMPDGIRIPGGQRFRAAELDSFGDHRIAMAFSIAALLADGACEIRGAEAASVSFPEFYRILRQVAA
ncbi:MAG TPA: 3-phosphoshikimate 1-carboxyvinyltransferase [Bryobacteraceae bacterium]|nr:3-phosphoshikimate 1-carboxyvinyltransferase [Bryobacteraceae bacterium]